MKRVSHNPVRNVLRVLTLSGLAAFSPAAFGSAPAAPPTGPTSNPALNASNEYMAHWMVTTWTNKVGNRDLQAQIDLTGTSILRDSVLFYESSFGNFPYAGPHLADNPTYMAAHLAKVGRDIAAKIPDPNFAGYVCIDYETWQPNWSRTPNVRSNAAPDFRDFDFKDDWEQHLLLNKPQVLRGLTGAARDRAMEVTYNQASQKFYLDTLREGKRLRPKAKWGFYGFPYGEYYTFLPAYVNKWRNINDNEMGWMFDAVDVIFPHVYSVFVTVEDRLPTPGKYENTPAANAQYIRDNTLEAVRVSRGKPVMPFLYFRYHPNVGREMEGKWVTDLVIRQTLEIPKQAGAKGVMIWDCIESEQQFIDLRRIVATQVAPKMNAIAVLPGSNAAAPRMAVGAASKAAFVKGSPTAAPVVVKPKLASGPNQ